MKKIIISYFFKDDSIPLGLALKKGFEANHFQAIGFHSQVEGVFWPIFKQVNKIFKILFKRSIDVTEGTVCSNQSYRERGLMKIMNSFNPDILLVIRGNGYSEKILQDIRSKHPKVKIIGWWVKDPRNDNQLIDDAKLYDSYYCMHRHGYSSENKIKYLPALGIYSDLYRKQYHDSEQRKLTDVCFVGGQFKRRGYYLSYLTEFDLEIYGPGWRKYGASRKADLSKFLKLRSIWGEDLVKLYNNSKIVINISQWSPEEFGGENLRLFDVPSCGAFLLTDHTNDLLNFFTPGVEIETFKSPKELRDKVEYYLSHPEEREKIAKKGYERSLKLPTYIDRAKEIINDMDKW
jgi:spore maturation protein CgeB